MTIVCPNCGAENKLPDRSTPGKMLNLLRKSYKCDECETVLIDAAEMRRRMMEKISDLKDSTPPE